MIKVMGGCAETGLEDYAFAGAVTGQGVHYFQNARNSGYMKFQDAKNIIKLKKCRKRSTTK